MGWLPYFVIGTAFAMGVFLLFAWVFGDEMNDGL